MIKRIHPHKAAVVSELKDLFSKSKSVAIVNYSGLKVSQATALRQAIRKAGGEYLVAKNTLFKLASGQSDLKIEGLSGFVFSLNDEVSAIKALAEFSKKNSVLEFKGGLLGNRILSAPEAAQLANIPDKATLVSQLLGSLKSPLFGLSYSLNWNISKLVRTLDAVKHSKS